MISRSLGRQYGILIAAGISLICLITLLISLLVLDRYHQRSYRELTVTLEQGITNQLQRDALVLAKTLAANLKQPIYMKDFSAIHNALEELQAHAQIGYTYIYDMKGKIIHDGTATVEAYGEAVATKLPPGVRAHFNPVSQRRGRFVHASYPIKGGGTEFAGLAISVAFDEVEQEMQALKATIQQQQAQEKKNLTLAILAIAALLLIFVIPVVFVLARRLVEPIGVLADQCQRIGDGDSDLHFSMQRNDELGVLSDALERMHQNILLKQRQIQDLAYLDPLTNIPNRRMFTESLEQVIQWAQHSRQPFALLFIDLDDFKQINDSAGHDVGDRLLQQVSERLRTLVLQNAEQHHFPQTGYPLLARLGGDEFVTLVPGFDDVEEVSELAADIISSLESTFDIGEVPFSIAASIGITLYPKHGDSASELLKHADIAMYAAKNAGRNRYRFFASSMHQHVLEKQIVSQGIKTAISEQQFELCYQPIFDLEKGTIIGAEAVIRWNHPEQGQLYPGSFIPLLETSDLIIPVTQWVLEHACLDLSQRFLPADPQFKLSLNISGSAFLKSQINANISLLVTTYNLPPDCLHLELTETSLMNDFEACRDVILEWKKIGVSVWLDDFGTGYSSLSYLHQLPIDGVKIDQSFVNEMGSGDSAKIIATIISLARTLNLETVSEGIQNETQIAQLLAMGNRYGQGYYLSKPVRAEQLSQQIQKLKRA